MESKDKQNEAKLQQDIVVWFRNNYCLKHHNPRLAIFSVPNEAGYKNKNFRLTGMMSGVSDLIVLLPNKVLFIELKTEKGKQSPKQIEFEETCKNLNHSYHVVRSLDQFKHLINE